MEESIIYEKKSNHRAEEFALETRICQSGNRGKYVVKTATYHEGTKHVLEMQSHYSRLSVLFLGSDICILPCDKKENSIIFPYLDGETLEEKVNRLIEQDRIQEAKHMVSNYLETIRKIHSQREFVVTESFVQVFGQFESDRKYLAADVNDIDLVLDNVIVTEKEKYLIDYEWTFDFPIPIDFMLFRILHYFIFRNEKRQILIDYGFLYLLDYTKREIECFLQMEANFQRYILGKDALAQEVASCEDMLGLYDGKFGKVYFDCGRGYNERQTESIDLVAREDVLSGEIDVPQNALSCRIDPLEGVYCKIQLLQICDETGQSIRDKIRSTGIRIGDTWYFLDTEDPYFELSHPCKKIIFSYSLTKMEEMSDHSIRKQYNIKKNKKRIENVLKRICDHINKKSNTDEMVERNLDYQVWFDENRIRPEAIELQRIEAQNLNYQPTISVVVLDKKAPKTEMIQMLNSLMAQTYVNWELCFFTETRRVLLEGMLRLKYTKKDSRISLYGVSEREDLYCRAKEAVSGQFVVIMDSTGVLEPDALYEIVKELQQVTADIVYTDEDRISHDVVDYQSPQFKPDYSPDLLRSYNYIGNLFVVKKQILDKVDACSSSYEYILRCVEQAKRIAHIPRVLYHGRRDGEQSSEASQEKMIEAHLERMGECGNVKRLGLENLYHTVYKVQGNPLVSIVIANKDHTDVLERCLQSILCGSTYQNIEFIIVENNSTSQDTFSYYKNVQKRYDNVKVICWEKEFNYSAINNYGVEHANGEYILLLNNDTEMITPAAIEEMLGNCMRAEVGAVGAKLLYEDDTIQHAGVVIGFGDFAGHVFHGLGREEKGYMNRLAVNGNYSAVTAACLMTKKTLFESVGGLTEAYAVAVNDVDYCLKLREKGYLIVYDAFSEWHHFESKTRGYENDDNKVRRFQREVAMFSERWGALERNGDPYYNSNFQIKTPFTLR